MAVDPKSCMDEELIDLMTECLISLGSDDEHTGESSSDPSSEVERSNIKVEVKNICSLPLPESLIKQICIIKLGLLSVNNTKIFVLHLAHAAHVMKHFSVELNIHNLRLRNNMTYSTILP